MKNRKKNSPNFYNLGIINNSLFIFNYLFSIFALQNLKAICKVQ